ncbi:MAG: hypothetical protein AAFX93_11265 [Verrucomicrobiota bacterium]
MNKCLSGFAVFGLMIILVGCESSEATDTHLRGRQVVNTTMGIQGFRFDIPAGYTMVDADEADGPYREEIAYYLHHQELLAHGNGSTLLESLLFSDGKSAIVFSVVDQRMDLPFSKLSEFQRYDILEGSLFRWRVSGNRDLLETDIGQVGGRSYAMAVRGVANGFVELTYVILGNVNETYFFVGATHQNEAASMRSAMRSMISTFRN